MRNSISITIAIAFLTLLIGTAGADEVVPGAYGQPDWSVMSVGKTQMQIGAKDRAHANLVNARSGAYRSQSNTGNGGGADFQWGSIPNRAVLEAMEDCRRCWGCSWTC